VSSCLTPRHGRARHGHLANTPAPDAEALQVVYDPQKVSYGTLLEFFYRMHDPTTENRQGPDAGTQYRSAIFYHNDEQRKAASDITDRVNKQWWKGEVTTEVLPAGHWWDAEAYHQLYLDNSEFGASSLPWRFGHANPCRPVRLRVPVAFPEELPAAGRVGRGNGWGERGG
jgi:methionine-S-sulfoxide reductase